MQCPLCAQLEIDSLTTVAQRRYYMCPRCALVSMHPEDLPDEQQERSHYLKHENYRGNPGYVEFLLRAIEPLMAQVQEGAQGIDYGSGPEPVAAQLLSERGHLVTLCDPIFAPCEELPIEQDFILSIETVEHFHKPLHDFTRMQQALKSGGVLSIMTLLYENPESIGSWWYARDFTHCCFYHERTFEWLAAHFGWEIVGVYERRVLLLKKH